ncbi:hypothetical protein SAMN06269250_1364 [Spirosoma fluviale]|uniref:Uncharacterized protein n=1 Tax=Spirosoma fluviale TaxID=1597977 RepID=A0A286FAV5_9BACT|nr:hypothetical protein SAMN06269250_1364 [Spirosoma fluviale]
MAALTAQLRKETIHYKDDEALKIRESKLQYYVEDLFRVYAARGLGSL